MMLALVMMSRRCLVPMKDAYKASSSSASKYLTGTNLERHEVIHKVWHVRLSLDAAALLQIQGLQRKF